MWVHDLITTIYKDKELWHFIVDIRDKERCEVYEMSRPMDANGINMTLYMWRISNYDLDMDMDEVSMEEIMLPDNEDLRAAVKIKQEEFNMPF